MSFKPVKIKMGLLLRAARSLSPEKPTQPDRICMTHEVRTAYLRREHTLATPAGTYTFPRGRQMPATTQPVLPTSPAHASLLGPVSSVPSVHRSSSLPGWPISGAGWESSFADPHDPHTPTKVAKVSDARKQWIKWTAD